MSGELQPLVGCSSVSLRFGQRQVLDHVSISVAPGEAVTLVGPNGSGKTTLVKVLLGLRTPDRGTVQRRRNLRVGYVPQRLHVDPVLPLSVSRLLQLTHRATREEQLAALTEVGMARLLEVSVHQLSGGELQRVLLARALLRRPELLVLDEPMQGVDVTGTASLYELIGRIRERLQCGILMVSHDLHLVMAATDRVVCLNHHVCCAGEPDQVAVHPEYQALFGSRVAANLAVYTHHHDHKHAVSGEVVTSASGGEPGHG